MKTRDGYRNLLLEKIEYRIDETRFGVWRRFLYPNGDLFEEFTAHERLWGLPLVHYTRGQVPGDGQADRRPGRPGRRSSGGGRGGDRPCVVGIIAIGQLAVGLLFGLGQAATGLFALGQLALAAVVGLGQFATGYVAIGQLGFGRYVLAQIGAGQHIWDMRAASPVARAFFRSLIPR
jgi:hypothetical protein